MVSPAAVFASHPPGFLCQEITFAKLGITRTTRVISHELPFGSRRRPSLRSGTSPIRHNDELMGSKNFVRNVLSPDMSIPGMAIEVLDAEEDEYDGIVINHQGLPSSANAFASALKASLCNWKLEGKRGVWLKLLEEQSDLIPIAIQEGFNCHHAEPGYVMLTYWIPDGPCLLPAGPSHQIGVGGFVINNKREVLAVKEKCSCNCSGVWKLPTGYINKSEDLFTGAIREVKEETGVDTIFLKMVAFSLKLGFLFSGGTFGRHVHLVGFEKSDILFLCLLKPLSHDISIDENEIQDAKWMPYDEFIAQPYYEEGHMCRKVIEICMAANEELYGGFIAHQLPSKLDGKLSYLYYDDGSMSEPNAL